MLYMGYLFNKKRYSLISSVIVLFFLVAISSVIAEGIKKTKEIH